VVVEKPEGADVAVPGDALVIRFRPTDPDSVLRRAGQESRRTGRRGASVFAAVKEAGETDAALRRRLLAVAQLVGMKPDDHPKYYVCAKADEPISMQRLLNVALQQTLPLLRLIPPSPRPSRGDWKAETWRAQ
jgi:hypothetical protein